MFIRRLQNSWMISLSFKYYITTVKSFRNMEMQPTIYHVVRYGKVHSRRCVDKTSSKSTFHRKVLLFNTTIGWDSAMY